MNALNLIRYFFADITEELALGIEPLFELLPVCPEGQT